MMDKSAAEIRNRVSTSYSKAIQKAETGADGCCGPTTGCCETGSTTGREHVPSFGCGDPLLFTNVEPGATVLDLGSGAGFDLIAAAHQVGPAGRVIGVDMTDDMISAARRNVETAGLSNVEIRKGIIEELPVESESIDWVISNCVINLSPEKERVFAEIARVLKPGGRFSISDICAENLPQSLLEREDAYDGCVAGAVSERDYAEGLLKAGLRELLAESKVEVRVGELVELSDEPGEASVWSIRFTGRKPVNLAVSHA
jgi:SAM-dependent methyltransferase